MYVGVVTYQTASHLTNLSPTVSVESTGCIPPEKIFLEAIKVMRKKIRNVRIAAEQLTQVAIDEEMAE